VAEQEVRLTRVDRDLLGVMFRYGYLTVPQMHACIYPDISEQAIYARLGRLQRAGLVRCVTDRMPRGFAALYLPTPRAHGWIGSSLAPLAGMSLATLEHTLAVADYGLRFEFWAEERVLTDREIKAAIRVARAEARDASTDLVSPWNANGIVHAPDLVLVRPPADDGLPQSVAIEIELSAKSPAALRRIMRFWQHNRTVGGAVYYVASERIGKGVLRAAREVGVADIVVVRDFKPGAHPRRRASDAA
jgi:hypothetical protein